MARAVRQLLFVESASPGPQVASLFVAVAVWNPVGIVSVPAVLASLALLVATVTPLGERYLGSH